MFGMRQVLAATAATVLVALAPMARAETLGDAMIAAYKNSHLLDQNRALLRAADEDVATAVSAMRPVVEFTATPEDLFFWEDVAAGRSDNIYSETLVSRPDNSVVQVDRRVSRLQVPGAPARTGWRLSRPGGRRPPPRRRQRPKASRCSSNGFMHAPFVLPTNFRPRPCRPTTIFPKPGR